MAKLSQISISHLARRLEGTKRNVYTEVAVAFGIEVGEEVFDRLRDEQRLVKCESCDLWIRVPTPTASPDFICERCLGGHPDEG